MRTNGGHLHCLRQSTKLKETGRFELDISKTRAVYVRPNVKGCFWVLYYQALINLTKFPKSILLCFAAVGVTDPLYCCFTLTFHCCHRTCKLGHWDWRILCCGSVCCVLYRFSCYCRYADRERSCPLLWSLCQVRKYEKIFLGCSCCFFLCSVFAKRPKPEEAT